MTIVVEARGDTDIAMVRRLFRAYADSLPFSLEFQGFAAELAGLLAYEEAALLSLLETGTVEWKDQPAPTKMADVVAAFERSAQAVTDRMAKLDEQGWTEQGQFLMEGAPPWKDSIENFVWGMFFDAIHHRGQLTTYLRPMGGKVPSIYGPSADDPGGA